MSTTGYSNKKMLTVIGIMTAGVLMAGCGSQESTGGGSITLSGSNIAFEGEGATVKGSEITISKGGTYNITGNLSDGQINVNSKKDVTLVLDGVNITNEDEEAIHIKNGDVTIEMKNENSITNGSEESYNTAISSNVSNDTSDSDDTSDSEDKVHTAIYAADDLTITGSGTLNVNGYINNGIHAKGKLSVGVDTLNVKASNHGIKSKENVVIESGAIDVVCANDGVHSNDEISINDGEIVINANDDGIHADNKLVVNNGTIDIQKCNEGLEAIDITVNDGDINIVSDDDGINACGGTSNFGKGGGRAGGGFDRDKAGKMTPGNMPQNKGERPTMAEGETPPADMAEGDATPLFTMNGGKIHIKSGGDGIDTNGDMYINGGEVTVESPASGADSAFDYASENGNKAVINGGTIIGLGSSSMAEEFDSYSSKQCAFTYVMGSQISAGTEIKIIDSAGNEIASFTTQNGCNCIQFSSDKLKEGDTYTITAGSVSGTIEQSTVAVTNNTGTKRVRW